MNKIVAIVPAAGSGVRMGCAIPKQYLTVHGRTLLWHSASVLLAHPKVSQVVVVIDERDGYWDSLGLTKQLEGCLTLRKGGDSRARTVLNALLELRDTLEDDDWVLVHDAARPCLDAVMLDRLFHEVLADPVGGLLAIPVRDTLKRATPDGRVDHTQPREGYWQAQTPQMIRYAVLRRALTERDITTITDEAGAVEALGLKPKLVQGSARNLKITYPEDVHLAEMFLAP